MCVPTYVCAGSIAGDLWLRCYNIASGGTTRRLVPRRLLFMPYLLLCSAPDAGSVVDEDAGLRSCVQSRWFATGCDAALPLPRQIELNLNCSLRRAYSVTDPYINISLK